MGCMKRIVSCVPFYEGGIGSRSFNFEDCDV